MKKWFILVAVLYLYLCLCSGVFGAEDYWIYIRKQTKITDYDDPQQVAGRSDTEDIVEVIPCTPQFIPTEKEKETYKIIKIKNLTTEEARQLKEPVTETKIVDGEEVVEIIKCRRNKLNLKELSEQAEFERSAIGSQIKIIDKTTDSPIVFRLHE